MLQRLRDIGQYIVLKESPILLSKAEARELGAGQ